MSIAGRGVVECKLRLPRQAERASPFPTKAKRQRERETGRATNGRPYGALLVVLTRNTRAGHAPPLQGQAVGSVLCWGGYHPPAAAKKAGGTVLPPAAFDAAPNIQGHPRAKGAEPGCRGSSPADKKAGTRCLGSGGLRCNFNHQKLPSGACNAPDTGSRGSAPGGVQGQRPWLVTLSGKSGCSRLRGLRGR